MKFVKMIMIVAVAASVLSLGACAQKKEAMAASTSVDRHTRNSRHRRFASDRTTLTQEARSFTRPGLFLGDVSPVQRREAVHRASSKGAVPVGSGAETASGILGLFS